MLAVVRDFGAPITIVACGVAGWLVGLAAEGALRRTGNNPRWWVATLIAESIAGMPLAWGVLLGGGLALPALAIPLRYDRIVSQVLTVLAIGTVTVVAARLASRFTSSWVSRAETPIPSGTIFVNLARLTVVIVGVLVGLASLGVSIAPLLTAAGVGGLAIALALQDTLGNLFAGLQVLLSKQIRPGDFIRLETGEEGHVFDVTWRNTTIKLLSNDLVIVPNSVIGRSRVTNFTSMDEQHTIVVPFQVPYSADLARIEALVLDAAREVLAADPEGVPEHAPECMFKAFGDSAIQAQATMRARAYGARPRLTDAFVRALHARFREAGIEFAMPVRDVRVERV